MVGVLEGLKVIDFTRVIAGSYCTLYLADLGAEVIKVETPGMGDVMRYQQPQVEGECGFFIIYNRGKKSITLNLKDDRAKDITRALVKDADIVVENFSPGTMKDLGLGYDDLKKVNPGIVYASISGYGQFGPSADLPSYDICIQGMCGLMSMNGPDEEHPMRIGMSILDIMCGTATAMAIIGAIYRRTRTGEGDYIDMSLYDVGVASLENAVPRYTMKGEIAVPMGSRHPSASPHNVYRTKDGYVIIIVIEDGAWKRLCNAMERPELIDDPEIGKAKQRVKVMDRIDALVEGWTRARSTAEVVEALKANRLAYGIVRDTRSVVEDPHTKARNMVIEVDQPKAGKVRVPGCPVHFTNADVDHRRSAPLLGQHTDEILKADLGMTQEQIDGLRKDKVI
jgi:CoA:oxalate CoA-transferase